MFENYCRNDDFVTFGRFCYGVTVILTYPIECFVTREVSTVSFNTLTRSFLYYINLVQFINHLILQIPKCMTRNIIHEIFSFTQFKDNSYSNVYELFFQKLVLKIMFGGLVYISISINIYTTAFQNECQPLIESNQDFLLLILTNKLSSKV